MIAKLFRQISTNISDVRAFGVGVVRRHVQRYSDDPTMAINVSGIGQIYVRAGESDIATVRQVFVHGEYDTSHPAALQTRIGARYAEIRAAGSVPIIADIGANIGSASLWFHQQYPEAAVVAVEPDPANARMLRRNLSGRAGLTVVEAAIGATPGFVSLENQDSSWGVQTKRSETGVAIVTVDSVFKASGGDIPFIVKIDIEGFESDLFKSNTDWINDAFVVMIEPHDWMLPGQQTSLAFQKAMAQHSFEMYIRGENIIYVRV